jgi:hypothetical protein
VGHHFADCTTGAGVVVVSTSPSVVDIDVQTTLLKRKDFMYEKPCNGQARTNQTQSEIQMTKDACQLKGRTNAG